MKLIIPDSIAEKIWSKNSRRISCADVWRAWEMFLNADERFSIFDSRPEHDTWPPTEWILVKLNSQLLKLVFIVDDEEDVAYLKTAFYVDQRTAKAYKKEKGIIYG